MEWLAENWLWIVIAVVFIAVHIFGHGGHGGHGKLNDEKKDDRSKHSDDQP